MINKDGSITIINEDGSQVKVCVLFNFEIEEYRKKYIAYTIITDEMSEDVSDDMEVLLSEIDYDTNEVKSIPESEMETVLSIYNQIKESLLNE